MNKIDFLFSTAIVLSRVKYPLQKKLTGDQITSAFQVQFTRLTAYKLARRAQTSGFTLLPPALVIVHQRRNFRVVEDFLWFSCR